MRTPFTRLWVLLLAAVCVGPAGCDKKGSDSGGGAGGAGAADADKTPTGALVEFYRRVRAGDADGAYAMCAPTVGGETKDRQVVTALATVAPVRAKFVDAVRAKFGAAASLGNPPPDWDAFSFYDPDLARVGRAQVEVANGRAKFWPEGGTTAASPWIEALDRGGKWRISVVPFSIAADPARLENSAKFYAQHGPAITANVAAGKYASAEEAVKAWNAGE